jgi:cytochrome c
MKRALFVLAALAALSGPVLADQALATAKNCMACHAVDKKLVGPAYKDVAKKYAGQKDAVDKLAVKIMKGGSGVWGPVPMPANPQVSEAEAKKLATWVLSLKLPARSHEKGPLRRAFFMAVQVIPAHAGIHRGALRFHGLRLEAAMTRAWSSRACPGSSPGRDPPWRATVAWIAARGRNDRAGLSSSATAVPGSPGFPAS